MATLYLGLSPASSEGGISRGEEMDEEVQMHSSASSPAYGCPIMPSGPFKLCSHFAIAVRCWVCTRCQDKVYYIIHITLCTSEGKLGFLPRRTMSRLSKYFMADTVCLIVFIASPSSCRPSSIVRSEKCPPGAHSATRWT